MVALGPHCPQKLQDQILVHHMTARTVLKELDDLISRVAWPDGQSRCKVKMLTVPTWRDSTAP